KSGGRNNKPAVPPNAIEAPCRPPQPPASPPIVAATITIGIATISLNAVVNRLRSRSGYSTENCTGYCSPPVGWLLDSIDVEPPRAWTAGRGARISYGGPPMSSGLPGSRYGHWGRKIGTGGEDLSTEVKTAIGKFVWHDHTSQDPAKARQFYGELFDWKYEPFGTGEMNYEMIRANGQLHGGF